MAISAYIGLGTLVEFSPVFPLDSLPSSFNPSIIYAPYDLQFKEALKLGPSAFGRYRRHLRFAHYLQDRMKQAFVPVWPEMYN